MNIDKFRLGNKTILNNSDNLESFQSALNEHMWLVF